MLYLFWLRIQKLIQASPYQYYITEEALYFIFIFIILRFKRYLIDFNWSNLKYNANKS